jgi:AmiR/NasT family two-component response regulator
VRHQATAHTREEAGPLAIVVANENEATVERAAALVTSAGHRVIARETALDTVGRAVSLSEADLAVVAVHRDADHALALVEQINDTAPCPVVLLLDDEDPALIRRALDRGLTAYVTRRTPEALASAIALAQRRFAELRDLGRQVRDLEAGSNRRALIERAKGVVMERQGIDERHAYALLRGHAREHRLSISDVAQAVMHAHELLPGPEKPIG